MSRPRITAGRAAGAVLLIAAALGSEGCYYVQAVRGHSELMSRRRPVAAVIADADAPESLRAKLALAQEARDYAVDVLLLPDNDSYRSYADIDRDYVVWNVFAAPELSLEPKTWCFPVAGCVAYRGYFSEDSAREFAGRLQDSGYDVAVGGVAAYSTLGRFDDPLLNTMMQWSDVDLVATMFHELAHQKLYVKGDSAFNESFATVVADIGIAAWLGHTGEPERLTAYENYRELRRSMLALVGSARDELATLYGGLSDRVDDSERERLRKRKREILDGLSADAERLVAASGANVRNWLAAPLNNANLVSVGLYEGRVAAFRAMYDACGGALDCFYARALEVGELDPAERSQALAAIAD
ncbi:MAG: aminopeptidase [Gammaproteobacteria bacterium]|nr:aminopeptidase [Gammaproteobacteria bacterium]